MTQEAIAEARAFVRAFDQTGNVDHDERRFVRHANHAELRFDGRKRVIRNLGARRRHRRQERRLPGVRHADDAAIGQQAQLETHVAALSRFAALGKVRRLPHAIGKMLISKAAAAAARNANPCLRFVEIGQKRFFLAFDPAIDQRSDRNPNR